MKKYLSIVLALILAVSSLGAANVNALAYENDCECCDYCTGEEGCECGCGNCDYCEEEEEEEEDEDYEDDETENDSAEYTNEQKTQDLNHIVAKQFCGESMFWYVKGNTLFIFGRGDMYDYAADGAPWAGLSVKAVEIHAGVNTVGDNAFGSMSFTKITLPSTVKTVGGYAFANCKSLTSVTFGKGAESIGAYAFYNCTSLEKAEFNANLSLLGESAFEGCSSLVSVTLPTALGVIKKAAFKNCTSLRSANLNKGLVEIRDEAFYNCSSLSSVKFADTVVSVGARSFFGCAMLRTLTLGENVASIGTQAFSNSGLEKIVLKWGVKKIDSNAFSGCVNTEVDVHSNAVVYKALNGKPNLKVVCSAHDRETASAVKATFTSDGVSAGSRCKACGALISAKKIARLHSVTLSKTVFTYNGKTQMPSVTVKDANNKTVSRSNNYTLTPSAGCCNVGTYSIKIDFTGNYSGSKTYSFKIIPKAPSVSKLTAQTKAVKVSLNKQTVQTTGYQLQYSTASSFSGAKTVELKNSVDTHNLKNLSAKKTYYFRIRSYKTVNGTKFYSEWSKTKSIKTK